MAGLFSLDSFDVLTGTLFTGKPITIHRHCTTALAAEHGKLKVWKERAKGRHIAAEKAFVVTPSAFCTNNVLIMFRFFSESTLVNTRCHTT